MRAGREWAAVDGVTAVALAVASPAPADLAALTAREVEVARAIARGMSNAEIAAELFLSEWTVKTHVASILRKLGLRDRAQVVVAAYESGLVERGSSPR
jgi:DNA-binding NarL/FixJ family response regulator